MDDALSQKKSILDYVIDPVLDLFRPELTQKDFALQPTDIRTSSPLPKLTLDDFKPKPETDEEHAARTAHKYTGLDPITEEDEWCTWCEGPIKMQVRRGTKYCSGNCEKEAKGEKPAAQVALPPAQVS